MIGLPNGYAARANKANVRGALLIQPRYFYNMKTIQTNNKISVKCDYCDGSIFFNIIEGEAVLTALSHDKAVQKMLKHEAEHKNTI